MKKFKVTAKFTTYCTIEVAAETELRAWQLAKEMDGGDFEPHGHGDWIIDDVEEITPALTPEQLAFVETYCSSVADATREQVVEFLQLDSAIDGDYFIEQYGTGTYGSIMDAYCVWSRAMDFAKSIEKTN